MFKKIIFTIILCTLVALPAAAQVLEPTELNEQSQVFFNETGLSSTVTIPELVSDIIRVVLGLLGIIFLSLIIYAGFMWMTAAGNDDHIAKAKKIMTAAIIGLAIVLAAYAITYFVIDQILEATKGGQGLD